MTLETAGSCKLDVSPPAARITRWDVFGDVEDTSAGNGSEMLRGKLGAAKQEQTVY